MHVARFALAPIGRQSFRVIDHRPGVTGDPFAMKGRRSQPPLALPLVALARQQTVSHQTLEKIRAQRHRLDEVLRVRCQHILNLVRMIEKQRRHIEKPHPDYVAVVALRTFDETKRIAIEFAHHSHDGSALWTRRTNLCL